MNKLLKRAEHIQVMTLCYLNSGVLDEFLLEDRDKTIARQFADLGYLKEIVDPAHPDFNEDEKYTSWQFTDEGWKFIEKLETAVRPEFSVFFKIAESPLWQKVWKYLPL